MWPLYSYSAVTLISDLPDGAVAIIPHMANATSHCFHVLNLRVTSLLLIWFVLNILSETHAFFGSERKELLDQRQTDNLVYDAPFLEAGGGGG